MSTIKFDVREIHSATFVAEVTNEQADAFLAMNEEQKKEYADSLLREGIAEYEDGSGVFIETVERSADEFAVDRSLSTVEPEDVLGVPFANVRYCARGHQFTVTPEQIRNDADRCPECGLYGHGIPADAQEEARLFLDGDD